MSPRDLEGFFSPRSVAVVGASARPRSVGHAVYKNLLFGSARYDLEAAARARDRLREDDEEIHAEGFPGPVYAVNRKGGELFGRPVYRSLREIGAPVDLVVVAIPPRCVAQVIDEAGELGTRHAIVISAGFAERGEEGRRLQDELVATARRHGMRLIGPNCLGVIRPSRRLNASFADAMPPAGEIGLLSQSGALITGLISYARRERFGLSAAVSLGAKADVDDEEVLAWFGQDPETRAVALYVESFPQPRRFYEEARRLSARKPVVAIKGGRSRAGARAASSHTGALAGRSGAYSAAFAQAGVLEARTIGDFMDWTRALATQPPPAGRRIAIVTNAGGPGVLSADAAEQHGLEIAELSEATRAALDAVLPSVWSHGNPVDVIGDATPERYRDALNIVGRAPEVDGVIAIMTVQAMTAPREVAEAIVLAHDDPSWHKPLLCSFLGLVGTETGRFLDEHRIPEFNVPEDAVSAMAALWRRGKRLRRTAPPPPASLPHPAPQLERARALLAEARAAGQRNLDLARAREVLAAAGIRYNRSATARDPQEAARVATSIGFPVVVKVVSPDVLHKSDVGGVVLHVADPDGVRAACRTIERRVRAHVPDARIEGYTIEQMVSGTEIIVGMSRDPDFGPLLMVGMGGVFVEVYRDVTFRLVPIERADAFEMIDEIRAQPLLDGARGRPKLDRAELAEILLRISELVQRVPGIEELDINPLVITDAGLVAIDARVIAATD